MVDSVVSRSWRLVYALLRSLKVATWGRVAAGVE